RRVRRFHDLSVKPAFLPGGQVEGRGRGSRRETLVASRGGDYAQRRRNPVTLCLPAALDRRPMNGGEQQTALERARQGDTAALGPLLDSFRPYVRSLVRALGCRRLQARVDESDLLQDALLAAHRSFGQFRGGTVAELTAWLRQIVRRTVGHSLRDHLE